MQNKREVASTRPGIKNAWLFISFVGIVIFLGVLVKFFVMLSKSTFDGTHRFTIAVSTNPPKLISFSPKTNLITTLSFRGLSSKENLSLFMKTRIDGFLKGKETATYPFGDSHQNPTELLSSAFFHYPSITTSLTLIDITRLWLFSQSVRPYTILKREISLSSTHPKTSDQALLDKTAGDLFFDTDLQQENISIQVVNATGISGIGNTLARVLTNMGANVISVTTDPHLSDESGIYYTNKDDYTLHVLKQTLRYPTIPLQKKNVADILIKIGKNDIKEPLLQ